MFKRMFFLCIAIFIFALSPNTASSAIILAGQEMSFRVEFPTDISTAADIHYNVRELNGNSWTGFILYYDELSDPTAIWSSYGGYNQPPIIPDYYLNLVNYIGSRGLFDDPTSFVTIRPDIDVDINVAAFLDIDGVLINAIVPENTPVSGNTPVPEPSTMLLLGSGLAGLVGYGRRRMKK